MSTPANFNGQRPVINPDDAVMLLIDHQSGLFQTVGDMPMTERSCCGISKNGNISEDASYYNGFCPSRS